MSSLYYYFFGSENEVKNRWNSAGLQKSIAKTIAQQQLLDAPHRVPTAAMGTAVFTTCSPDSSEIDIDAFDESIDLIGVCAAPQSWRHQQSIAYLHQTPVLCNNFLPAGHTGHAGDATSISCPRTLKSTNVDESSNRLSSNMAFVSGVSESIDESEASTSDSLARQLFGRAGPDRSGLKRSASFETSNSRRVEPREGQSSSPALSGGCQLREDEKVSLQMAELYMKTLSQQHYNNRSRHLGEPRIGSTACLAASPSLQYFAGDTIIENCHVAASHQHQQPQHQPEPIEQPDSWTPLSVRLNAVQGDEGSSITQHLAASASMDAAVPISNFPRALNDSSNRQAFHGYSCLPSFGVVLPS